MNFRLILHAILFQLLLTTCHHKMPIPQGELLNTVEAMSTEYEYEYCDEGIQKQHHKNYYRLSLDIQTFFPLFLLVFDT